MESGLNLPLSGIKELPVPSVYTHFYKKLIIKYSKVNILLGRGMTKRMNPKEILNFHVTHERKYDRIEDLALSTDGSLLAVSCDKVSLWDVKSASLKYSLIGTDHYETYVEFSPDSSLLVSDHDNYTMNIWNVNTGFRIGKLCGHSGPINAFKFSSRNKLIVSGSRDGTIRLWDINNATQIYKQKFKATIFSVNISPINENLIAFSSDASVVGVIDTRMWRKLWQVTNGEDSYTYSIAFSPNGENLAYGNKNRNIRLHQVDSGLQLETINIDDRITRIAFLSDGQELAFTSSFFSDKILFWNLASKKITKSLPCGNANMAVSGDGRRMASSKHPANIHIWDLYPKTTKSAAKR